MSTYSRSKQEVNVKNPWPSCLLAADQLSMKYVPSGAA